MSRRIALALTAIVLAAAGPGLAAQPAPSADQAPAMAPNPPLFIFMMKNFDLNRDGKITADEVTQGAKSMFDAMDTDKSGTVTFKEINVWRNAHKGTAPGNPQQAAADAAAAADNTDTNVDDASTAPATAANDDQGQQKAWTPDTSDKSAGKGKHHKGGKLHAFLGPNPMTYMDADNDKKITLDEATAGLQKLFKSLDLNHDGIVSIDDFPG